VALAPALPASMRRLRVEGLTVSSSTLTVSVEDGRVEARVDGDLALVRAARSAVSPLVGSAG